MTEKRFRVDGCRFGLYGCQCDCMVVNVPAMCAEAGAGAGGTAAPLLVTPLSLYLHFQVYSLLLTLQS